MMPSGASDSDPEHDSGGESVPWAKVPVWVLGQGLKGNELAVYVALRSFCDRHGVGRPRVKSIAGRAGVSERTVERALAKMQDGEQVAGGVPLLTSSRRYRTDGSISGCEYRMRLAPPTAGVDSGGLGGVTQTPGTDADDAGCRSTRRQDPARVTEQEGTDQGTEETTPPPRGAPAGAPPPPWGSASDPHSATPASAGEQVVVVDDLIHALRAGLPPHLAQGLNSTRALRADLARIGGAGWAPAQVTAEAKRKDWTGAHCGAVAQWVAGLGGPPLPPVGALGCDECHDYGREGWLGDNDRGQPIPCACRKKMHAQLAQRELSKRTGGAGGWTGT